MSSPSDSLAQLNSRLQRLGHSPASFSITACPRVYHVKCTLSAETIGMLPSYAAKRLNELLRKGKKSTDGKKAKRAMAAELAELVATISQTKDDTPAKKQRNDRQRRKKIKKEPNGAVEEESVARARDESLCAVEELIEVSDDGPSSENESNCGLFVSDDEADSDLWPNALHHRSDNAKSMPTRHGPFIEEPALDSDDRADRLPKRSTKKDQEQKLKTRQISAQVTQAIRKKTKSSKKARQERILNALKRSGWSSAIDDAEDPRQDEAEHASGNDEVADHAFGDEMDFDQIAPAV